MSTAKQDTILEKRADIESIQTALRELIVELEIALQLPLGWMESHRARKETNKSPGPSQ